MLNFVKVWSVVKFLKLEDVIDSDIVLEIAQSYQNTGIIEDKYRAQADEIAEALSTSLDLKHTAEEWLNTLLKFIK